ncbi:MAG: metallophosphoesterase [Bacteroidales bacterium]|nr:metallophosphoesterase [Bacteroidales bacterium]
MYFIAREYSPQPTMHDNVEKILVIGDIHGNYNRVKDLLVNAEIVNTDLNWTWGKGHLVFLGDIFDRGDDVTSILWLIYSLQQQAKKYGGMVHLLLGNHEVMIMEGDERYISDKYIFLTEALKKSYSLLFGHEYILGRWLRAQNTIIRINRILFVHGGISPGFIDKELALSDVNDSVRMYLTSPGPCGPDSLQNFLFGSNGPFWYRGYIPAYSGSESISEESVNELLSFYGADRIIYGHTPGSNFRFSNGNHLIGIDVSASYKPDNEQALLILDGRYYKVYINGTKVPVF